VQELPLGWRLRRLAGHRPRRHDHPAGRRQAADHQHLADAYQPGSTEEHRVDDQAEPISQEVEPDAQRKEQQRCNGHDQDSHSRHYQPAIVVGQHRRVPGQQVGA
jgi:hypothetical protein